ncbi:hypothetical protein PCANB_001455 [Pneumocystis canis]|nr:hypothetical protein PCK1_001571 [Pneumocystis canis]KAG5439156.1 hypothetical protein PCANB_001455 [Pneumocystis canis]
MNLNINHIIDNINELRRVFLNESRDIPLDARFRALFSLKMLGNQGHKEAIDILAEGFKDDSELLKHEIAYVLGQTQNKDAVDYLENILKDESQEPMVRHEAAEALGALNSQKSLPLLKFFQKNDPLEIIRQTCDLAIHRIEWEKSEQAKTETMMQSIYLSIDPAPSLPNDLQLSPDEEVVELGKKLLDQTLSLFYRYRVMFRLRNIGTNLAVQALAEGFKDPSALFRHEIAYIFGQMCSPLSIPYLIDVLSNLKEEPMVRHEAAEALGSIGTPEVRSLLKTYLKDKERVIRESCIVAINMYEYEHMDEQTSIIPAIYT